MTSTYIVWLNLLSYFSANLNQRGLLAFYWQSRQNLVRPWIVWNLASWPALCSAFHILIAEGCPHQQWMVPNSCSVSRHIGGLLFSYIKKVSTYPKVIQRWPYFSKRWATVFPCSSILLFTTSGVAPKPFMPLSPRRKGILQGIRWNEIWPIGVLRTTVPTDENMPAPIPDMLTLPACVLSNFRSPQSCWSALN